MSTQSAMCCQYRGIQHTKVLNADTYEKLSNVFLQCLMSLHLRICQNCGRGYVIVILHAKRGRK